MMDFYSEDGEQFDNSIISILSEALQAYLLECSQCRQKLISVYPKFFSFICHSCS